MRRFATALAVLAGLAGCADRPTRPTVAAGEEFQLAAGHLARLDAGSLVVRFDAVASDSRCPADALCVTQGRAEVEVTVTRSGGEPVRLVLLTAPDAAQRAAFGDWTLTLVRLEPYPYSASPIAPGDYRARLRLDRNAGP